MDRQCNSEFGTFLAQKYSFSVVSMNFSNLDATFKLLQKGVIGNILCHGGALAYLKTSIEKAVMQYYN